MTHHDPPDSWPLILRATCDTELEGDPRPRAGRNGIHMDPVYLRCMARLVTMFMWAHRGAPAHRGWTFIRIDVVCPRPQTRPLSVPNELWSTGERVYRIGKPDGDNAEKAIWDALVKANVLHDDSHVVEWQGARWYAAVSESARVEVSVKGVKS